MVPGNGIIICQNDAHTAWLNKVSDLIQKEETDGKNNLSWSAHFVSLQKAVSCSPAITGLLPLFRDSVTFRINGQAWHEFNSEGH